MFHLGTIYSISIFPISLVDCSTVADDSRRRIVTTLEAPASYCQRTATDRADDTTRCQQSSGPFHAITLSAYHGVMDEQGRLLRLLSLVYDASERGVSLRFADDEQRRRWFENAQAALKKLDVSATHDHDAEDKAATQLHLLGAYFAGASSHHANPKAGYGQDAKELPEFALETIGYLTDLTLIDVGRIIVSSLGLRDDIGTRRIADRWVADVEEVSWRILVDRQEVRDPKQDPT